MTNLEIVDRFERETTWAWRGDGEWWRWISGTVRRWTSATPPVVVAGRVLDADGSLCGHIYFHLGDDSGFRAVRPEDAPEADNEERCDPNAAAMTRRRSPRRRRARADRFPRPPMRLYRQAGEDRGPAIGSPGLTRGRNPAGSMG